MLKLFNVETSFRRSCILCTCCLNYTSQLGKIIFQLLKIAKKILKSVCACLFFGHSDNKGDTPFTLFTEYWSLQ